MNNFKHKATTFEKRKLRVRSKIKGLSSTRPRLTVFRSNRFIYLQVIDHVTGKVLASSTDAKLQKSAKKDEVLTKIAGAKAAATSLSTLLKKAKVESLVFDRGAYKYHGRVKAVAETLREQGLAL
jgi:large subunit ribosomal protein L18